MRSKFKWIFTLVIAFVVQLSFAQEKVVTGTVSDDLGPIVGANVVIKGTTTGTTTNFDGNYTISAKQGDVLTVSFVNMQTQEITVGAANEYNVVLKTAGLRDELKLVSVGYSQVTREQFTGTAAVVDMENIEAKTVSNVGQALRGEVAGVNVISANGAPGQDATIRIRGWGSVNGNRNPLYVVDGVPYTSDISAINPADIESTVVLKDAAATSIYGSRGANGVILITTKQGREGKSKVLVDFRTSINTQMLPMYDVLDTPEEYIEMAWSSLVTKARVAGQANPEGWASANLYGTAEGIDSHYNVWDVDGSQLIDSSTGKIADGVNRRYEPTRWDDAAFGTGYRTEANVQFSGGDEKTRFATSFGYLDDQGYVINSNYRRYTARLNLEHKVRSWLTLGGNMAFTGARYDRSSSDENQSSSSGNIFALTSTTPAIYDVYMRDDNGELIADPYYGGYQYDYGQLYGRRAWNSTNGIADAKYDLAQTDVNTMLGNFNIGVDITDWLKFEGRYSGQYQNSSLTNRNNPYYGGWAEAYGYLYKRNTEVSNQNFLQLLRFNKLIAEDHSIEAFVAHESTEWRREYFYAAATKEILPNSTDLYNYTTPYGRPYSYRQGYTLESYFGQLNYDFVKKYYLTASVRRDGSSRFRNDKWGTFWSAGASWIISKEDFFSNVSFNDYLKLKASYGVIGDQGLEFRYGWQEYNIEQTVDGSYAFPIDSEQANPDLTWETSKIAQVGIESTWFNNTIDLNVDYYVKNTENLFFEQTLPPSPGPSYIRYNDGVMQNSGLEFDVQAHVFKAENKGDFKLSVGVNGEMMKNEITEMPNDYITGEPKVRDGNLSKGHSIYDWYMREWAGVDTATGVGMWYMNYNDVNNNGVFDTGDQEITSLVNYLDENPDANVKETVTSNYSQATQRYVGKTAIPDVRGAFRINASYRNFDLTAQMGYSFGGYGYDAGYARLMDNGDLIGANNWHTDMYNAWKQPGDITNVPRLTSGISTDVNWSSYSSRFLTKSDYFSLNNVRLGYTVPSKFTDSMNISRINLFVSGDNLLLFSARDGYNPMTFTATSNSGIYMPMTSFSFGAKVEF